MKRTFIRKGFFACIATLLIVASSFAQTITNVTVSPAAVCAGSSVSVSFTTTGTFPAGTEFTAQLSDASGAFGTPVVSGTGTVSPISLVIPAGSSAGTGYKIRVISASPAVTGSESAITINAIPGAPAVTASINYTVGIAATPLQATGTGLKWYTSETGGTGDATAPTPSTTTAGTTSYWVSQTTSCEGPRAKIDVIVTAAACVPPAAPTVVNKTYKVGDVPVSLALSVTGDNLLWYDAETGGTGSATVPTISTAAVGTKSYWVSQTVGCESPRAKIDVIVSAAACVPPAAPVVVNKTYKVGDVPVSLALSVTGDNLLWYDAETGGTGSATVPTISTAAVGTKSYWVSQTVGCESPRAKIDIIISAAACVPPAAPAVVNKTYKVGDVPVSLALSVTGDNLLWYDAETGGTGSATVPAISTAAVGTKSYWVSQTVGCESPRAKIDVIVSAAACVPPAAPAVVNKTYKVGDVPVSLALSVTGDNLLWYDAETGGTGSATVPTISTAAVGTKSYWVSQTVGCESPRAKIDVIVSAAACVPPAAPAVVNKTYKVGDVPVSLALSVTGANLLWYDAETGGTGSATVPVISTTTVGTKSYWVSQTVGCESPRAKIDVIVSAAACVPPAAPAVVNKTYKVGDVPVSLALSVTGANLLWYDAETGGTGSANAPTISTAAVGTKSYWVSQTVNCESPRAKIDVIVTAAACVPPAAPAVVNKTYKVGDVPVSLALSVTGANLLWYDAETGGTGSATAPTLSTAAVGTKSYWVSQTVGCESPRAKIDVIVSAVACVPPAAPAVVNKAYKVGDVPVSLALSVTGANLLWYDAETGGTGSATAPTLSTAAVGTKSYWVSQTVGCESPRAKIDVIVSAAACVPPAAPAVVNKTYKVGDVPVSLALSVTGANLLWYDAETGGTGSVTVPAISTAAVGTKSYWVSQTVGCESPRAKIDVIVTAAACVPPAAPTVVNATYTVGAVPASLASLVTGTNLLWYDAATGGTGSGTVPTISTAAVGTKSYWVSQTIGCESARAKIDVIVSAAACVPPAAPTVSNVNYTVGAPASVLTATGTNLKWYTTATGGTGSSTAPTPSTATAGTTSYWVSQTIGCESIRAKIDVIVVACTPPASPAVIAIINYCAGSPSSQLTATGTNLKWYTTATGGTASSTAPTPSTATAGTTSYWVSQTVSCESARAKIDVVIKDTPLAPTVSAPNPYCVGQTTVALTPSGDVYKWYTSPTGGTGSVTAPTPTATTAGTTSYYVSQSNTYGALVCEGPRAKVDVVVNPLPAALATVSDALCQELTDKIYTFPTQATSGNTINWYTVATGGTATKTVAGVNLKTPGETTYYATQVTAAGCESASRSIQKIRVKSLPAAPTIPNPLVQICQFIVAQPLTATPIAGGILNWYGTNPTGGTPSATAPTPSTATGGTTTYYVGQTLDGCVGERTKIDVKINTTPKPTTTTALAYCQNENAPILAATGTTLKWYRTGAASDTEFQGFPYTPYTGKVEDYSFFVTQTGADNGCESPREEIKIHIKPLPSVTISGNTTIDLGQTATLKLTFTSDGPWKYTLNGVTDSTTVSPKSVSVSPKITTAYQVTAVSNVCGQGTPIGSALVTVKIPTIFSGNPTVSEVCAGKSFGVPFSQSGEFPAANKFNVQISLKNEDASFYTIPSVAAANMITATFPDTTAGGDYFVRVVSSGADADLMIRGTVSGIGIIASPLPVATISGSQTILIGESADLKVELIGKSPLTFALYNGIRDSLITTISSSYSLKVTPSTTTTYTISTISNVCGKGRSIGTATIQVDPILAVEPPVTDWLKVYPTIIDGQCTVEIKGPVYSKEAKVQVIDMNGRPVFEKAISTKNTDLDFVKYPSGLYLLQIQNGNLNSVQRVMKP